MDREKTKKRRTEWINECLSKNNHSHKRTKNSARTGRMEGEKNNYQLLGIGSKERKKTGFQVSIFVLSF